MRTKSAHTVYFNHKASLSGVFKTVKMQSVSMQDLKQFSYWQEKRLVSSHWYNIYNPVISVELTELYDRVVENNDAVEEIQLDLTIHQHRIPAWNESLVMSMGDALLRSLQRWITSHSYSMKTRCFISLPAVESIALPLTRCLGVLTNIPIFAFFPWTVSLSRTFLAMLDCLSYNWLLAQLQSSGTEFKLVITFIREES